MKKSVQNSGFHLGNIAFRSGDFENAAKLYQLALAHAKEPLANQLRFNLSLVQRKLFSRLPSACFEIESQPELEILKAKNWDSALTRASEESCQLNFNESIVASINLPFYDKPTVSVLIPVFGKLDYTIACLRLISQNLPKAAFEVLVLDDRSPDETVNTLKRVKNLRLIENPQNLGFLKSCNNGAKHARGEYLFFLNNDTEVTPGWLDELLLTFENFPKCGLAGSKLVYPDGTLQEAGGIVWRDGSAWNFGNRQSPELPEFNYAREVDYISGAAIMIKKALFDDLGGFDDRYAPAYYEDTDLAFLVRARGMSVIYQPLSKVVHFEGVSSGTDLSSGVKAYQAINAKKFFERWQPVLFKHKPNADEPFLEKDRNAVGRVLFVDACTPTPDMDSGSIDVHNLLSIFIKMGWAVTFIPEDNYAYMEKYTHVLQRLGVHTLYYPHTKSVSEHVAQFGRYYDLVKLFRPQVVAKHIDTVRQYCPKAKIVYNTVDLHYLRMEREADLKKDESIRVIASKMKHLERSLMEKVDLVTVVSSYEHELLQRDGVTSVIHLPFSRKVRPGNTAFEDRKDILFVGGFQHTPNVDAVFFFINEIMPLLRPILKGVKFQIVGSNITDEIKKLASSDIIVHGFVEDIEPILDAVRVNVAPLRYGAGTKGKVVMAMASGLPSIGTSIAFEGMGITSEVHAVCADTPHQFANALINLYRQKDHWERVASAGLELAKNRYGLEQIEKKVREDILSKFNLCSVA